MSSYQLVTIDPRFIAETIARTGSEQLMAKATRSYIGIYDQDMSWYIPLRSNLGKKKPEDSFFETPFKTTSPHFIRPGLDYQKALFVPKEGVMEINNTLPEEQYELIRSNKEKIKQGFEKYVMSLEELSPSEPRYLISTVPLFPEGVELIKKVHKDNERQREASEMNEVTMSSLKVSEENNMKEESKPIIQDLIKSRDYQGLAAHLKDGVRTYLESDTFKEYLNFVSKFHKYSSRNVRLILGQKPDARYVASFKKWKEMDRVVKKGSKAIYVYAPSTTIKKDSNGEPVKDAEGNIVKMTNYMLVPVFDVSQTQGEKELPKPIYNLEDNLNDPKRFSQLFKGLSEISPVPVKIDHIDSEATGFYHLGKKEITIKEGLGQEMTLKTLTHEITHALMHANSRSRFGSEGYRQQEFEAEAVAYIVCNHLGIDSSSYSFGYLSSWTDYGKDIDSFAESLERITFHAQQMINQLDKKMQIVYGVDPPENKFEERLAEAQIKKQIAEGKPIKREKKPEVDQSTKGISAPPKVNRPQSIR